MTCPYGRVAGVLGLPARAVVAPSSVSEATPGFGTGLLARRNQPIRPSAVSPRAPCFNSR